MRGCEVYIHGIKAGVLTEDEQGYAFTYDRPYLLEENNPPVSLTMPLQFDTYSPAAKKMLFKGRTLPQKMTNLAKYTAKITYIFVSHFIYIRGHFYIYS